MHEVSELIGVEHIVNFHVFIIIDCYGVKVSQIIAGLTSSLFFSQTEIAHSPFSIQQFPVN